MSDQLQSPVIDSSQPSLDIRWPANLRISPDQVIS